jgi:predicted Zn finger-like uncharacterized protein
MSMVLCPNCQRKVRIKDGQFGRVLRCSKCSGRFMAEREVPSNVVFEDYTEEPPPVQREVEQQHEPTRLSRYKNETTIEELRCDRCGSDQVQSFRVIHEMGTTRLEGTTTGSLGGLTLGTRGTASTNGRRRCEHR